MSFIVFMGFTFVVGILAKPVVNKYATWKGETGYKSDAYQSEKIATFHLPIKKTDLYKQCNRFVN